LPQWPLLEGPRLREVFRGFPGPYAKNSGFKKALIVIVTANRSCAKFTAVKEPASYPLVQAQSALAERTNFNPTQIASLVPGSGNLERDLHR